MNDQYQILIKEIYPVSCEVTFPFLRKVPQYVDVQNIIFDEIDIHSTIPLSRYIVRKRLLFTENLVGLMKKNGLQLYEPIIAYVPALPWRLILPPVVEKHDDRWVVFDGMHRIWYALKNGVSTIKVICIYDVALGLPTTPITWEEVSLTDTQYKLEEILPNLDIKLFRPISKVLNSIITVISDEVAQTLIGGKQNE